MLAKSEGCNIPGWRILGRKYNCKLLKSASVSEWCRTATFKRAAHSLTAASAPRLMMFSGGNTMGLSANSMSKDGLQIKPIGKIEMRLLQQHKCSRCERVSNPNAMLSIWLWETSRWRKLCKSTSDGESDSNLFWLRSSDWRRWKQFNAGFKINIALSRSDYFVNDVRHRMLFGKS